MKYVLKHKKNRVYLKYYKKDKFKHYVRDIYDSTFFESKKEANTILDSFKHSENWEVLKINYKKKKRWVSIFYQANKKSLLYRGYNIN